MLLPQPLAEQQKKQIVDGAGASGRQRRATLTRGFVWLLFHEGQFFPTEGLPTACIHLLRVCVCFRDAKKRNIVERLYDDMTSITNGPFTEAPGSIASVIRWATFYNETTYTREYFRRAEHIVTKTYGCVCKVMGSYQILPKVSKRTACDLLR